MNFAYLASFGSFPSANCLLNELLYHLASFFVIAVLLCFVVEKQMIGPNFWDGTTLLFCFQKLSLIQVVMGVPKKWSSYCFFLFVFNTLHRLMGTISEKFHQHQLCLDVFAPNFWKPQPYKTIVAQLEQWNWDLQMQVQTLQKWA